MEKVSGTDIYYVSGQKHKLEVVQGTVGGAYMPGDLTADSIPDLDSWGMDEYWSGATFVEWHKMNVQKYGRQTANAKMLTVWEEIASDPFGQFQYWNIYSSNFRNYFTSQGVDLDSLFSSVIMPVTDILSDTAETASKVSGFLKSAAPFVVGGALLWGFSTFVLPAADTIKKQYA